MKNTLLVSLTLLLAACPDPGKNKTKAVVEEAKAVPAPAALEGAAATTYAFSNEGSKFAFVGAKVTGKHDGGFNSFKGTITVKGDDLNTAAITAVVDPASVFSDNEKLTGHLQSPDFFDVAQFPEAKFESTSVKGDGGAFTITGNLTLHGVTKSITFPAKLSLSEGVLAAAAEFVINRKDFGIEYAGKADDLIADNVAITLELHAKK